MDILYAPRKRDEEAVKLLSGRSRGLQEPAFLCSDGTGLPTRTSRTRSRFTTRGRELMKQLYELRKRDCPPVTGAEALEVSKAAGAPGRASVNGN